ncbi:MAG: TIGR02646 family protein [Planctomycetes bacterium]|nr:TIGR02646 family protein [Planctomycetota bacterium]
MHAVKRSPEPPGLSKVRDKHTPRWVTYYNHGRGKKPSDSKWRDFHKAVSEMFFGLCAYCEENDKGEVDHFRPKSRFPDQVYRWDNWVLACHTCNNKKSDRWPPGGYIDPCAKSRSAQPESYFTFDTVTGELLPKPGLTAARRRKAVNMIRDLGLNAWHHLGVRIAQLRLVEQALAGRAGDDPFREGFLKLVTSRETTLSSITRAWLNDQGHVSDGG